MKDQTGSRQTTQGPKSQTTPRGQFLNKKQLAALLGLSIFTIDSWVSQRREIPFVKMGKRVKFATEDVMEWIEKNKQYPIP